MAGRPQRRARDELELEEALELVEEALELEEAREAFAGWKRDLEERRAYSEALALYASEQRAEALVRWADDLSDDEVRALLTEWWTMTEAWSGDEGLRAGMLGLLRRVSPLCVTDEGEMEPSGVLTIYRGNLGEDARLGHSWSLDLETAQKFAQMANSPRGMFLGMYREDGVPSVWRALVNSHDILGYFNDRGEREIVVDPATLLDVIFYEDASNGR
jgi:hypothetical protein